MSRGGWRVNPVCACHLVKRRLAVHVCTVARVSTLRTEGRGYTGPRSFNNTHTCASRTWFDHGL